MNFSPAIQMLYDEHQIILQAIAQVLTLLDSNSPNRISRLRWYVNFFRMYGDKYHHQKEEDILFQFLQKDASPLTNFVDALTEHHELFRNYLKEIDDNLLKNDIDSASRLFKQYLSDLRDHISAEDDEFFITVESHYGEAEKENLYYLFLDQDRALGVNQKQEFEKQIKLNNEA
ncbi:MAG: hemerythrin domain-containing protein [Calditrichaeota bacterium]|nr:MAG: hemerythrin domain-containing protein [Calditrichota bacterium]